MVHLNESERETHTQEGDGIHAFCSHDSLSPSTDIDAYHKHVLQRQWDSSRFI